MEEPAWTPQPPAPSLELPPLARWQPPDPDNPHWGAFAGIGIWLLSFISPLVLQIIFIIPFTLTLAGETGGPPAQEQMQEELTKWIGTPTGAMVVLAATIGAQLITIIVCWMVVTRNREEPFFESLGWHWADMRGAMRVFFVLGTVAAMYALNGTLVRFLPESEQTDFQKLLSAGLSIRIVIVVMAVLTAPIVEEVVYRGVLYSGLRHKMSMQGSVIIVTLLFVAVHVPQYWGAWAGIVGLIFLSFTLTVIRAFTKSILPCVAIHLVFNLVASIFILTSPWG